MSVNLSPLGGAGAQFFTNDGVPLTGGLLYTYQAGSTTPATTYTSGSGITALANPIILDAAGRVPTGEIWLTDGIAYKFVLKDSTDVLIATWDGLSGINSNFIAYSSVEETATATAGQTVFDLTINYIVGANSLAVFVNGSNQIVNVNYLETDENTVTFLTGLNVGDVVKFSTATPVATNAMDAANVSYTPAGIQAITTNVQAKLRETVSVLDFGAILDDSSAATRTLNTTALTNALAYANTNGSGVYIPAGTLWIDSGITLSGCIYGDPTVRGGSIIKGDGDLFTVSYAQIRDLTIANDATRGKLFSSSGGAVGRTWFFNCELGKSTYHIYATNSACVDWKIENCRFSDASIVSRYYTSVWAYTEINSYTWQGAIGLKIENGNLSTAAIYGSTFEILTDSAIVYASNTAAGEMNSFLISGTHFEANGSVTNNADIEINITGATRARCLTVENCAFFLPTATQTQRINITASGGGSTSSHTLIGCQVHGTVTLVNNTSSVTVLNCDLSSSSFGASIKTPLLATTATSTFESGTYTAVDGTVAGLTLTTNYGSYQRVGDLVTVMATITYPTTADTTATITGGLPYTVTNGINFQILGSYSTFTPVGYVGLLLTGTTSFRIYKSANVRATNADMSAKTFNVLITYTV